MRGPSRGACLAGILVRLGLCRGGKPAIVKLPVTFHDFQSSHADFQLPYRVGLQEGLVKSDLNAATRSPVFAGKQPALASQPYISSATSFGQWFAEAANVNKLVQGSLAFAHQNSTDLWTFSSRRFFPLDKKGWQTNSSTSHNYHFTMEMHLDIKYNGGEKFTFRGDDDVWVFINNKLAIDIGGVHGPMQRTVDLDTLGLKKGSRYPLDLFYAERKCCGSHILISTTLDFEEAKPYQRTPENTLQEIDVEEVEIEKEWMSIGWFDNNQCAGTPMHIDVFSSGQCLNMAPYVFLKTDASTGLNVEIEVEKEHLYKNVKATCADSKMELKSYDEFGKCVDDDATGLVKVDTPLFEAPISTNGCIKYAASRAANGLATGHDVWFSPRCDIKIPCEWKDNGAMGFKFYSVVNSCDKDKDDYPDFYRVIPGDAQCVQTSSPISTVKYTSTHTCEDKKALKMRKFPSTDGIAADKRCSSVGATSLTVATENCAGSIAPLGDVDPGGQEEVEIFFSPINTFTCDQERLEFFADCPSSVWVWVGVFAGSVLLVVGLASFFLYGPGKKTLDADSRNRFHDLVFGKQENSGGGVDGMHRLAPAPHQMTSAQHGAANGGVQLGEGVDTMHHMTPAPHQMIQNTDARFQP